MQESKKLLSQPPLDPNFFQGDVTSVARRLLGKVLITKNGRQVTALILTEVEAYSQDRDEASHCYRGKTERNASMFEIGGTCYVYRSYGIHNCVNVVSGKENVGSGILLRAGVPLIGLEIMAARRGLAPDKVHMQKICKGPGRLTQAMGIDLAYNGQKFNSSYLRIVDAGFKVMRKSIIATPRIGISKAVDLPWRFVWEYPAELFL